MTKKKIKLPIIFWKNPVMYIKFHRSMNKIKKSL